MKIVFVQTEQRRNRHERTGVLAAFSLKALACMIGMVVDW